MTGNGNWVKLHRCSIKSRVFSDDWLWKLWCWCLLKAYWTPGWFQTLEIQPGQFAFTLRDASEELEVSKSHLHSSLLRLQEWQQLTLENSGQRFSVVTICNWASYQEQDNGTADTDRTLTGHRADTEANAPLVVKERKEKTPSNGVCVLEQRFDQFWKAYPRKVGKAAAKKVWMRLRLGEDLQKAILDAIRVQERSEGWLREFPRYIPHPATWLNEGRWEDEVHVKRTVTLDIEDRAAKTRRDRIAGGMCPVCGKSVVTKECICVPAINGDIQAVLNRATGG